MPYANASGTHKLPLLVIGTAQQPRTFKSVNLPVLCTWRYINFIITNKSAITSRVRGNYVRFNTNHFINNY